MKKKILLVLMVLLCWNGTIFSSTLKGCEVDSTFSYTSELKDELSIPVEKYDEFVFQIGNFADICYQLSGSSSSTMLFHRQSNSFWNLKEIAVNRYLKIQQSRTEQSQEYRSALLNQCNFYILALRKLRI